MRHDILVYVSKKTLVNLSQETLDGVTKEKFVSMIENKLAYLKRDIYFNSNKGGYLSKFFVMTKFQYC